MARRQDQIRGCLLGGAAGDALGYCAEELTLREIREKYGPEGLRGYDTINGYAVISSHTQMTLFTANALLFGATRGATRGVMAPYVKYLEVFYREWAKTQHFGQRKELGQHFAWISDVEGLWVRRSPDNASIYAMERPTVGTMDEAVNMSQSPAGLCRCAPIGLFFDPKQYRRTETVLLGGESAALTQGDPMGFLPAAVLTDLLNRIIYDKPDSFRQHLYRSLTACEDQFGGRFPQFAELREKLEQAERLAGETQQSIACLEQMDFSTAAGVLAGACYLCLKFPGDFDRAIVAAVNHSGPSSAVGTVTGAILGALLGTEGIPDFYLDPLELHDCIRELADDLYQGCPMTKDSLFFDSLWEEKYVQIRY